MSDKPDTDYETLFKALVIQCQRQLQMPMLIRREYITEAKRKDVEIRWGKCSKTLDWNVAVYETKGNKK